MCIRDRSEFALLMGFRNPQRTWDLFTELGVGDVVDPCLLYTSRCV